MSSQTAGAVTGPPYSWFGHGIAVAEPSCATRFSLARGATGAAPCKAPVGGGVGGPRAVRGSCAPATGAVEPRHLPESPRDFPRPPLRHDGIPDGGVRADLPAAVAAGAGRVAVDPSSITLSAKEKA